MSEKKLHPLLNSFKERMRIFHDGEDENLSRMLEGSQFVIFRETNSQNYNQPIVRELILERARYIYNDQVDTFYKDFKNDLHTLAFQNAEVDTIDG